MYYDENEYLEACAEYDEAEKEAERVISEVFSDKKGVMPKRSITEQDIEIMNQRHQAWEKMLEIAHRQTKPGV